MKNQKGGQIMDELDIERRLTKTEERARSNTH